jgi:hypothetical protein
MPFSKFKGGDPVVVKDWQHKDEKGVVERIYPDPGEGTFTYAVKFDNGQVDHGIEEKHMKPA